VTVIGALRAGGQRAPSSATESPTREYGPWKPVNRFQPSVTSASSSHLSRVLNTRKARDRRPHYRKLRIIEIRPSDITGKFRTAHDLAAILLHEMVHLQPAIITVGSSGARFNVSNALQAWTRLRQVFDLGRDRSVRDDSGATALGEAPVFRMSCFERNVRTAGKLDLRWHRPWGASSHGLGFLDCMHSTRI
jgi:hypothetical protein